MKKNKGFFIVLDGIDGAGKTTQTKILIENLKKNGYETATLDFPRYYDNFFGEIIGNYLKGDFGKLDPKIASILYALDRWQSKTDIEKELKKGKIFVCNRYMSANMIHQGGRIENDTENKKMMKWLETMEFDIFGIPKPDLVIYLDVPADIGQKLVDKKSSRMYNNGKKRDIHEADKEHLINARNQALKLVKKNKNWQKINCVRNEEILEPEKIGGLVWKKVLKKIA